MPIRSLRLFRSLPVLLLPLLAACHVGADMKSAEDGVAVFHARLNAEQYDSIFNASTARLRQATPQKEFMRFMSAVHAKLGRAGESKRTGWKVEAEMGGPRITMGYDTRFEHGTASETFEWRMVDGRPALEFYNINSSALVTN